VLAMFSRYYRELSAAVTRGSDEPDGEADYAHAAPADRRSGPP
jgi:hypothetical protein